MKWVELTSRKETGEILALFRILTGLGVLWNVGSVVLSGAVRTLWIDRAGGGFRRLDEDASWLIGLFGGPTEGVVWTFVAAAIVLGVLLVLGLGGRITALLALQVMFALSMINPHAKGSYDALSCNALWLLVLAGSTATWSLDARIRTGSWQSDREVSAFPRYLAIFQLVVVYFFNAVQKVSAHWTIGGGFSALYYILQQPTWQRFDMTWAAYVYPLTQIGTFVTWVFELGSPLLLLWYLIRRRARFDLRIPFVIVGLLLHLGILILLEVGPFSLIVLAFYPCLFAPSDLTVARSRLFPVCKA
jgi:hypothetical protein